MSDDNDIRLLKKYLTNKDRILHSISTAENMMKYAPLFNIDKTSAYFCGLYHDIAKEMENEELLLLTHSFLKRKLFPIHYLEFKKRYPSLLHGIGSAEILIRELSISNKDQLSAICSHTLGGNGLSRLSKYTFMFDFCEPLRKYKEAEKIFQILITERDFDKAYLMTYVFQLTSLFSKNKEICLESINGYNDALFYTTL